MRHLVILAALLVLSGCGLPANVAVLIPDEDGSVGRAIVKTADGQANLDGSFDAVSARSSGTLSRPFVADRAEVDEAFRGALGATPRPPIVFIVHFVSGQAAFAPGAQSVLSEAIAKAKATPDADISVVGHSDRTGTAASNLALSLQRANAVRDAMVAAGVKPDIIDVSYHGANNPVVKTGPGVAEARNRRVEITIR